MTSSVTAQLFKDVLSPRRERELFDLLNKPQDGGRPSPLEQVYINTAKALETPEGFEMISQVIALGLEYTLGGGAGAASRGDLVF